MRYWLFLLALMLFVLTALVWTTVRLVNGSTPYEGRVEVKVNGTWGTVCEDRWSVFDGHVVCRQLGFDGVWYVLPGSSFGQGSGPIFHDDLQCTSHETDLSQCPGTHVICTTAKKSSHMVEKAFMPNLSCYDDKQPTNEQQCFQSYDLKHADPKQTDCSHKEDAGVKCKPPSVKYNAPTCLSTQFKCLHVNKCVPRRWLCDGHDDCGDKSDEQQLCHAHTKCGKMSVPPVSRRIVGGRDATPGSWPWMASILVSFPSGIPDRTLCGGTLINGQWVLTAAHCFDMYKPSSSFFHVVLGDSNKKVHDSGEQTIGISHIYIHHLYRAGHHDNDIALIKLKHTFNGSGPINYACVPILDKIDFGPDDVCYITGWGQTQGTGSNTILQQAQVPIIDNKVCNRWYANDTITDNMICAGYQFGGVDACTGDSGGPLSCKKDGLWYVAGIISWGNGCAQAQQPGIYVNVKQYFDWIVKVIKTHPGSHHQQNAVLVGKR